MNSPKPRLKNRLLVKKSTAATSRKLSGDKTGLDNAYLNAVAIEAIKRKRRRRHRLLVLVLLGFGLAGVDLAFANLQNISDWWRLQHYQAPAIVAQLATQDGMTDYARKVFYVNQPAVDTGTAFTKSCPNNGEQEKTIVLGCYHGAQNGIFLLRVNDPLLNGVEQVTAAHELLHAAYDRLDDTERAKIDALLQDYYDHDLHDSRVLATIAVYKQSEPNDVMTEMHSVFGTEVANLPVSLEQYYSRYFKSRQQVVAYAARYQSEFTSRQQTLQQDDAQLTAWKTQIDASEADTKAKLATINARQASLAAERDSGNISAYNAGVPGYNALVNAYNAEISQLQALIEQYNQLVVSRNAVALEADHLASELSATPPVLINN